MLRLFTADPHNTAYNISASVPSPVVVDAKLAARAHEIIISRHEVLRSAFQQDEGGDWIRTISRHHSGGVRMLSAKTRADAERLQLMDRSIPHEIDTVGIRCNVVVDELTSCHQLGINIHHVLTDADGMMIYIQELMQILSLFAAGYSEEEVRASLPPLMVQFADFAYWQKSLEAQGALDPDLSYWYKEVVSSTPPVVLDLPIDKPRPRFWRAVGASERCLLDQELLTPLTELTGRATPMAVVCTNFAIALSRLSGAPVLDIAIPFALRSLPALSNLIGNFLNMMPVRTHYDPEEPYLSMLDRVASSIVNVQKYSLSHFIQLVEGTRKHFPMADPSRNPIYATMVDLVPNEDGAPATSLLGVLDIFLFVNTRRGVIWSVDAVYNTTIFQPQTVRMLLMQMMAITRQAARAAREPIPRSLRSCEEAECADSGRVELTCVKVKAGFLPTVMPLRSGFPETSQSVEYFGIRRSRRLHRHSGLQFGAHESSGPPAGVKAALAKVQAAPAHKAVAATSSSGAAAATAPSASAAATSTVSRSAASAATHADGTAAVAMRALEQSSSSALHQSSTSAVVRQRLAGQAQQPRLPAAAAAGQQRPGGPPRSKVDQRSLALKVAERKRVNELISLDDDWSSPFPAIANAATKRLDALADSAAPTSALGPPSTTLAIYPGAAVNQTSYLEELDDRQEFQTDAELLQNSRRRRGAAAGRGRAE